MMQTGTEYRKPFGKEIFGREAAAHYAYPRENLIAEPIFPYFVLDGGAFNLANDRFGTADGDDLLALTRSGKLFEEFRLGSPYNWERSFAYTGDTGFRKKYEWQIWPQRLYMTIPLAHAFLRTGDRQYADQWLELVRGWAAAHPYQDYRPEVHYMDTDMVWRDMQVGWRTLSLLHGVFMLQDAPFTQADWQYIYDLVRLHVSHIYRETRHRLTLGIAGNHFLQIGVALIMAGCLLPELSDSAGYIEAGSRTVELNLHKAIYADGGSNEDSPSYSHFIVRLYLEAYLLLKNNGCPPIEGLRESIVRQYEWLYQCQSPSGRVLRFSDSFGMDAMADLRRAERLIDLDFPRERGNAVFRESGMAVLRRGRLTLAADGMRFFPGHQHLGRPQILLFYGEDPILIDAGCCNYDRWELYLALRAPACHNILFCPDFDFSSHPDAEEKALRMDISLKEFDSAHYRAVLLCRMGWKDTAYEWERELQLEEDRLIITDRAEASEPIRWLSSLFFARRDSQLSEDGQVFRQLTEGYILEVSSDLPARTELVPVMNDDNKLDYAVVTRIRTEGRTYENRTVLSFIERPPLA